MRDRMWGCSEIVSCVEGGLDHKLSVGVPGGLKRGLRKDGAGPVVTPL
jgi:hypothetical protein